MYDIENIPQHHIEKSGSQSTIALFLALYLLILAFFILLVSISTLQDVKAKAAMTSVTTTFSNILPPSVELKAFSTEEGEVLAGQAFQEEVTNIFATAIQVAKVETVQPGRLMRVLFPADALFFPGKTEIRQGQFPFLDRIVAALSNRPPGVRYDMEFVIGSPFTGGKNLPIGQTLEIARGGVFARELRNRGAPPDSISIGLMPGNADEVIIRFYIRSLEETKLKFEVPGKDG
ncbi:MAG: hypothetical protein V3R66_08585 [Rhodospirillales bacterium]